MKSDGELAALALPYAVSGGLFGSAGAEPSPAQRKRSLPPCPWSKSASPSPRDAREAPLSFRGAAGPAAEEFIPKKLDLPPDPELRGLARALVAGMATDSDEASEERIRAAAEACGAKMGDLLMPSGGGHRR
jgi:glutamyl-tRNA synthetase